jgi:hypothetical protein
MIAMDIWTTFGVPTLVYCKHIECGCKTITSLSLPTTHHSAQEFVVNWSVAQRRNAKIGNDCQFSFFIDTVTVSI